MDALFPPPNSASEEEMKEVAARICRDYLNGAWKSVTADDIKFRRISGGLSNFLYYVSLPDDFDNNNTHASDSQQSFKRLRRDSSEQASDPREVLLRVYGQSHGETAMLTELVVFTLLSERNLGPKLHGIFPGGRIEQYIPARALRTKELANPNISMKIAEKMAEIHTLNIPISKEPEWIWKTMGRWLKNITTIFDSIKYDCHPRQCDMIKEIRKTDLSNEVFWLKSVIENSNYPVKFCHNDLQEGNILVKELSISNCNIPIDTPSNVSTTAGFPEIASSFNNSQRRKNATNNYTSRDIVNGNISLHLSQDKVDHAVSSSEDSGLSVDQTPEENKDCAPELFIIDYEYCAYNYRGFDLANHFIEWTFDYTNEEFPYYYHFKDQYPTVTQRKAFIRQYLKTLHELDAYEPSQEELNDLIQEVGCLSMASHLFWSLWAIVNVHQVIEFGYWDYALSRLQEYHERKKEFMELYAMKTHLGPK